MSRRRSLIVVSVVVLCALLAVGLPDPGLTQAKPEGEMRWALQRLALMLIDP